MRYNASMTRTRIAPSPTGYPHIGTIYQALFDFAASRKNQGKFIVRIEDTDRERFVEDAEEKIFASLDWFGLSEDESPRKGGDFAPYRQSERLEIYKKYAEELVVRGSAYYCFCTKERLVKMREDQQREKKQVMYDRTCRLLSGEETAQKLAENIPWVIRLKVPDGAKITFLDGIRGGISFDSTTIDDQVLLKSDGFPTYHLAVVVDDHLMEISHVVRGEEWITSTPKHILLYDYFGWEKPLFFHVPLLRLPDKSKISKRHGHTNVQWYKEQGYLPEAVLNFLALMGWSHPEEKEFFTLDEFISIFDLTDIKAVGPIFDLQKLDWLNGMWIRHLYETNSDELAKRLETYYENDPKISDILENSPHRNLYIGLAQTRMKKLSDFKALVEEPETSHVYSNEEKNTAKKLLTTLESIDDRDWKEEYLLEHLKKFKNQYGVSMKTIYVLITGKNQGLPLLEQMVQIDKKQGVIKHLREIVS